MKIKSIVILLTYLLLLSSLTVPGIACPPPYCGECEVLREGECEYNCSSGQCCDIGIGCVYSYDCSGGCTSCSEGYCTSECEECEECVDDECIPCKCWDTGAVISGSITVQNAKLCEQVTHTSSISDSDHWLLGADSHGYPSDTVTYSWSASDGTPATSNSANFTWTAPNCTGQVNITLTADDVPDSMDNPCPDSTRDDPNTNRSGTSTVSLPSGCFTGTGGADLSVYETDLVPENCFGPKCGFTTYGVAGDTLIIAEYDSCNWVFLVGSEQEVRVGPCTNNFFQIDDGDDSDLNEDNFCDIVDEFVNDNGCGGHPVIWYSNAGCIEIHEDKHFEILEFYLALESSELLNKPSMSDMAIDCDDPFTHHCDLAVQCRQEDIENDVADAYYNAFVAMTEDGETEPVAAARPCFQAIADSICAVWDCTSCQ